MRSTTGSRKDKSAIADDILAASRFRSGDHVFFVGPYGARINFSAQQLRSLNLVWALFEKGLVHEGSSVAVVGAGLAGLAATAALATKKCKVTLYEKEREEVIFQARTYHRFVHPTLNFWPFENVSPTSEVPFMDWCAGICSDVVADIASEWRANYANAIETMFERRVTNVDDIFKSGAFTVRDHGGERLVGPYDAVIFATGFGKEKAVDGEVHESYWDADSLDKKARAAHSTHLICGLGDGALIDLFRLAYITKFQRGMLLHEVAMSLSGSQEEKTIRSIELAARAMPNPDAASTYLYSEYYKIADDPGSEAMALLDAALPPHRMPSVLLVGPLPSPFSNRTAPLHKLLLAHLINRQLVVFKQGNIVSATKGQAVIECGKPPTNEIVHYHNIIVRRGSDYPLVGFFPSADVEQLKIAQEARSHDVARRWPRSFYATNLSGGKWLATDRALLEDRIERLKRVDQLYKDIRRFSDRIDAAGRYTIVAELKHNSAVSADKYPSTVFGFKFEVVTTPHLIRI